MKMNEIRPNECIDDEGVGYTTKIEGNTTFISNINESHAIASRRLITEDNWANLRSHEMYKAISRYNLNRNHAVIRNMTEIGMY